MIARQGCVLLFKYFRSLNTPERCRRKRYTIWTRPHVTRSVSGGWYLTHDSNRTDQSIHDTSPFKFDYLSHALLSLLTSAIRMFALSSKPTSCITIAGCNIRYWRQGNHHMLYHREMPSVATLPRLKRHETLS